MDAYDIFKKLSSGAKFKRKGPQNSNQNQAKKTKLEQTIKNQVEIKEESIDNGYEQPEIKVEDSPDKEITLLGSITATESGKKFKKKKQKVVDDQKKQLLEQEEINRYRNENRISVNGSNCPPPIKEFNELQIGADLIENLKKCGYESPTPIQKQAIPIMLQRRQILGCAPTGSGKTAAFLIPIIQTLREPQKKGFRALIVCPTRELAKQTQRECVRLAEGRGLRIHVINKISLALKQYGEKSSKKFDILATTPNRLCYLLKQEPPAISLENVEWLVIDEADKLFEGGVCGFREQLDQIMSACSSKQLRIAMFSATQTVDVGKWCKRNMKGMINCTIGLRNAATDLVDQELLFVGNESGKLVAFRNIVRKGLAPPVLVFVQSKDRAQQLFNELIYDGINVDVIHAERTQTQRDNSVRSFREGKVWVLICTELLARGIDFKGVNLVVNYDFPPNAIAYIHRIGRAGRAGRKGKAVTFFTTDDTPNLRSIAQVLRQSGCEVPDFMVANKKKRTKFERNKVIDREEITTKPKYIRDINEMKKNGFVKQVPTNKDIDQDLENNRGNFKEKLMKNKDKKIKNSSKKTYPEKPLKKPLGKRKKVEKKQRVKK